MPFPTPILVHHLRVRCRAQGKRRHTCRRSSRQCAAHINVQKPKWYAPSTFTIPPPLVSRAPAALPVCSLSTLRGPLRSFSCRLSQTTRAPHRPLDFCWRASRYDLTNAIVGVDIDSIGISAGRRGNSPIRPSAVHPRSPARVPCIPRTLAYPALVVPCACTRLQAQQRWQPELSSMQQLRQKARQALFRRCWEGSGQGSGRSSEAQQAQSVARARGSGRAGQMRGVAHVSADAGEPRGCRFIGRLLCSVWRPQAQHGGGGTVQVQALCHRCRARWAELALSVLPRLLRCE